MLFLQFLIFDVYIADKDETIDHENHWLGWECQRMVEGGWDKRSQFSLSLLFSYI